MLKSRAGPPGLDAASMASPWNRTLGYQLDRSLHSYNQKSVDATHQFSTDGHQCSARTIHEAVSHTFDEPPLPRAHLHQLNTALRRDRLTGSAMSPIFIASTDLLMFTKQKPTAEAERGQDSLANRPGTRGDRRHFLPEHP
jgi:hypothetical protein